MGYYTNNVFPITRLNRGIVATMFGRLIGGAQGIQYLDAQSYMQLVTVAQIRMATQSIRTLTHLMTSITPANIKETHESNIDSRIDNEWDKSFEYRNCIEAFAYNIGGSSAEGFFLAVKKHIILHHHYYNTAPTIASILGDDALQRGEIIMYEETIFRDFCATILHTIEQRKQSDLMQMR